MLVEHLQRLSQSQPDTLALVGDSQQLSYAELEQTCQALAAELSSLNTPTIALRADNSPAWVVVDLACQQAGLCLIPLPSFFSQAQCQHALGDSGAGVLIEQNHADNTPLSTLPSLGWQVLDTPLTAKEHGGIPAITAKITYTSGSTSQPKGVCLSLANQLNTAQSVNTALENLQLEKHLAILPLATLLENVAGVYAALLRGATVCLPGLARLGWAGSSGLDIGKLADCIDHYQANSAILLPQILKGLTAHSLAGWQPPACLKFLAVGGARVAPEQILSAREQGLPVYEGYGLSECASVLSLNTPDHDLPGSAGRPLGHTQFHFEDGELIVTGNSFLGYLGQIEATNGCAGSSVATGDLAELNDQGFLQLRGRSKNVLVSSYGRNISPEWLESELLALPGVQQCIVLGEAKRYCCALIYHHSDHDADGINTSIHTLNQSLPDYAQIKNWQALPEPLSAENGLLTANGRLRRLDIAEHYRDLFEACYPSPTITPLQEQSMSFFQKLQAETATERAELTSIAFIQRGVAGELSLEEYIAFLTQAYHHVKHTVPLLMACGSRLADSHEWLREAVAEYIEEEVGHQEWILNDIAACGGDKEAVRNSRPDFAAELMVAYAYDTIQRGSPVGFFGMVQVLEGTSIAIADAAANAIQTSLGLPNKAFSYLKSHGALDIEHVKFFETLMDKIENPDEQQEIIHRAKMFYRLYGDVFRTLDTHSDSKIAA